MCKQELLPLFTLKDLLVKFQLLCKSSHQLVKDHYLSEGTLPINQLESMIIGGGQFGNVPMSIEEFYQAVCVVEEVKENKGEEEEKKEESAIEVDKTIKTSKIDIAKLKRFITGQWQCSKNANIYWRYDKISKSVNTLVYAGDYWDWK